MSKETEQRVFVALLDGAGRVFVSKRSAYVGNPGQLGLLGGHLDEGETLEDGARRELHEEAGLNINFYKTSFIKVRVDAKRTILVACMPETAVVVLNTDEVESATWFTQQELVQEAQDNVFHKSLAKALPTLLNLNLVDVFNVLHD